MTDINAELQAIYGRPMWFDFRGRPLLFTDYARLKWHSGCFDVVRFHHPPGYRVSTVWMGLDMGLNLFEDDSPPLIFETMIFADATGDPHDVYQRRYYTEAQAVRGHYETLAWLCMELEIDPRRLAPWLEITGWNRRKALEASPVYEALTDPDSESL